MSQPHYQQSYRRRPIVVRDPKTGETRLVGGGSFGKNSNTPPRSSSTYNGSGQRNGYTNGFRSSNNSYSYDRPNPSHQEVNSLGFDDEGRAPIMKIVSGYRGRQIVVRDPSRRSANNVPQSAPLGVRTGGVRKAHYGRRGSRTSPYSEGYEDMDDQQRQEFYDQEDEEEEARLYGHDGGSAFDRDMDHRMETDYEPRYADRRENLGRAQNRRDTAHDESDDLTGRVVYVDNLSDDVTTTGLANLFGMVGAVKELRLLYDREGNPNGSADIVFQRRRDAQEAIRSLDNVPLNNRPMKLSMGNGL